MASFADESEAVRAGIEILAGFETFRRSESSRARVRIKVGLYAGPCFAVTANEQLDYFGQVVNIAARLQGEAKGGELVVPTEILGRISDLPPHSVGVTFDARLKGVAGVIPSVRIGISG